MATKYSDIITIKEGKPAYNIANEEGNQWTTFIPNKQFNDILHTVIQSVRNTDINVHRSFWVSGSYGTGKSHAGAVIKHLLCDKVEQIKDYVDNEYREHQYDTIRNDIYSLRENKRLFPVMLYGANGISDRNGLPLILQQKITEALKNANITISVKTDYDNLIEHIEKQPEFWEMLIKNDSDLQTIAPNINILKNKLQQKDTSTFLKVEDAQRRANIVISLSRTNLSNWFFEVQNKLAQQKEQYGYDGLLVIWDEFTDLVSLPIGSKILLDLQEIDEKIMNKDNNSYFFYISHPDAFNGLDKEEIKKTQGRYHYMPYQMETVSAFKIMSHKFRFADSDAQQEIANEFYNKPHCRYLLSKFSPDSANTEETEKDLFNLFPLHPSTANLATYYAREVGSTNRSVFEFMSNNETVRAFLDNEEHFRNKDVITADYLWDYVQDMFNNDVVKYGMVMERYNSRHIEVEKKGYEYSAVFKGILLLNALNNIAMNETVTPSGDNIKNLFIGTSIEPNIDDILKYFDQNSIIQRLPGDANGLYSIKFSALPQNEIAQEKENLKLKEFKYIEQLLNVYNPNGEIKNEIKEWMAAIMRPFQYQILSQLDNEPQLINKIEQYYKKAETYEIFMVLLFGKNTNEVNILKEIAEKNSSDNRFKNIIFIVFDEPLTDESYERFIEYMADSKCAGKIGQDEQKNTYLNNACSIVKDWLNKIKRKNFSYYINGITDVISVQRITNVINTDISPKIYFHGPESLTIIQRNFKQPDWKKQVCKAIVQTILSYNSKSEIINQSSRSSVAYIFQDSVDENLEWLPNIDKNHPLYLVSHFINERFEKTSPNNEFNMGTCLKDLTLPPFGLYKNMASMSMVAFALRKWVNKIYDLNGKPREQQHIKDDIVLMFNAWEENKEDIRLNFRFETEDSRHVCENLTSIFKLQNVSSLTDARNSFKYKYLKEKGYPLWSLKFVDNSIKDGFKKLLDNILKIIGTDNTRDPQLLKDILEGFRTYKFELTNFLNDDDSFKKGFGNYMLQLPNIQFAQNEFEEALNYLNQHLQNESGLWSEEEVSKELSNWRAYKSEEARVETTIQLIGKATEIKDCENYLEDKDQRVINTSKEKIKELERQQTVSQQSVVNTPQFQKKLTNAINKVENISDINIARELLKKICTCEDKNIAENIIKIINDYDA